MAPTPTPTARHAIGAITRVPREPAQHSTAPRDVRADQASTNQVAIGGERRRTKNMSRTAPPTPLMRAACSHAEDALVFAIEAVDAVLHEDGCALEYPALVAGYMAVVAGTYQALTIRDAVDAFIEAQEEKAKREKYALCVPTLKQ
jgi:hypothetical protein